MMKTPIKSYSELVKLSDFFERFEYLRLDGKIGEETFGFNRYLNQKFYTSKEWRDFRRYIVLRDMGCDLACSDRPIPNGARIYIHHLNPIFADDVIQHSDALLDPENVILTTHSTHNAIHYGDASLLTMGPTLRTPNDTCPWR